MAEYALLLLVVGAPIVLGIIFRVSASHLFFGVMAGELLARYFGKEAELAISTIFNNDSITEYSHLLIMSLPVILTAIVLKRSISHSKALINIFPLVVTGLVFGAFAIPELPHGLQEQIQANAVGKEFVQSSGALVGFVVLFQLVVLWLMNHGEKSAKHRRRHKRRKKE